MASAVTLQTDGGIAVLTLNRPDQMNPLGQDGDGDLVAGLCAEIERDESIRCTVLTGDGKAFSAGGDVKAMKERSGAFSGTPEQVRQGYRKNIHKMINALYNLETPVVTAINGAAIGLGCDVACMGDIRIASEKAKFGVTFLKLGLIPGDGGAWLLPRIIGDSRAAELLFTGKIIDAETAVEWGLVSKAIPGERLMDEAMALACSIAQQPPQALKLAKVLLRHGKTSSFPTLMEMSAASQAMMHFTEDHQEGVDAILHKRDPVFRGE